MIAPTVPGPIVLLLCGAALVVWPGGPAGRRLGPAGSSGTTRSSDQSRAVGGDGNSPRTGGRSLSIVAPAAVLLLVAPETWWLLVLAAALVLFRLRTSARGGGGDRSRRCADLAVHHELLAACLDAGMPIGPALRAVADSVPPSARGPARASPVSDPWVSLDGVAAMLELGAGPDAAWASVDDDDDLRPLAAAARRSALGGAGLADAVRDQARSLRSQVEAASRRATGRAGVLMVAPLGLCFLPAFLVLGLAPVVLALLSRLHLF